MQTLLVGCVNVRDQLKILLKDVCKTAPSGLKIQHTKNIKRMRFDIIFTVSIVYDYCYIFNRSSICFRLTDYDYFSKSKCLWIFVCIGIV